MAEAVGGDWVEARASGVRLRLRVHPGARRARIVGPHGGALKIEVIAAPEGGGANRAVEALLADVLGVPGRAVRVVSGAASRTKAVEIDGVTAEDVRARVTGVLGG